jgi:putative DNA primase/helicase
VSTTRIRERLAEVAEWRKLVNGKKAAARPDANVARLLIESPELRLPPLAGITEIPVLRPDGTFVTRRGYDPPTRTFLAPSGRLGYVSVPDAVSADDVVAALGFVNEMLRDFPFKTAADKTNALALMLTPILRPVIDGPVPMAAVGAPVPGSGKSLFTKCVVRILTGRQVPFTSLGRDNDEAEKRLTAALLEGPQFVILDNLESPVTLTALKMAITAELWKGRIITTSKMPSVPVTATFIGTGNNLSFDREMADRVYLIAIEVEGEFADRPRLRPPGAFRHVPLEAWVRENRGRLLEALLTLARAWTLAGMPLADEPVMGSFESWSAVVGGAIGVARDAAGTPDRFDFLGNEDRKRESAEDDASEHAAALLEALATWSDGFTAREVARAPEPVVTLARAVLPDRHAGAEDVERPLGYWLRSNRDRTYGRWKLVRVTDERDRARGGKVWRSVEVTP